MKKKMLWRTQELGENSTGILRATGNVFLSRRYFWVLQVALLIQCIDSLALSNKNKKGKGNFFNIYQKIELKVKH